MIGVTSSVSDVSGILGQRILSGRVSEEYFKNSRLTVRPSPIPRNFRLSVTPVMLPLAMAAF